MALSHFEKQKYFKFHNLNKKLLENAINLIKTNIKECYRAENSESEYTIHLSFTHKERIKQINNIRSYNRILFGLMVSWSDESIRRLFYEPNVFTENQIEYLLTNKALEQKWILALKLAFCKAYNLIPAGNENCQGITINTRTIQQLDQRLIDKYNYIRKFIKDFLIPAFNIRNKVQHGEWIAAFAPPHSKVYDRVLSVKIFKENIVTINARMKIFNSVYQMITDLARFISQNFKIDSNITPFEYFYDLHIKKIEQQKTLIEKPELNEYINALIVRKENGKKLKQKDLTLPSTGKASRA